jgi:hypothetical protein
MNVDELLNNVHYHLVQMCVQIWDMFRFLLIYGTLMFAYMVITYSILYPPGWHDHDMGSFQSFTNLLGKGYWQLFGTDKNSVNGRS